MESTADGSTATASASAAADPSSASSAAAAVSQWKFAVSQRFQHLLDKSTPFIVYRWIAFVCIALIYGLRVYLIQGFYVVSYALGIYLLNLLVGFLSPQDDPEFNGGPTLPIRSSEEFRPFVRRLPEFKFWYSITKAFSIAFVLTFFSVFDVPVFWPILLFYWVMLCTLMLRRQILHMIKYKYVPFSFGKQIILLLLSAVWWKERILSGERKLASLVGNFQAMFWASSGCQWIEASLLGLTEFTAVRNPQTIPTGDQDFFEYILEFIRDVSRTLSLQRENLYARLQIF